MIRVGFIINPSEEWLGGINYFRNLLHAIHDLPNRLIEPIIVTGYRTDSRYLADLPPFEYARTMLLDRLTLPWLARNVGRRVYAHDFLLERLVSRHNITVLSHSGYLGRRSRFPTLGWIPDFQHKHLPEFFTRREISRRDREHKNTCKYCTRVVVSSHDALNDLTVYYPACATKAHVLQFVAGIPDNNDLPGLDAIAHKYDIRTPYFFLPNQFWGHKNHRIVLEALHILNREGINIQVIATGNPNDRRQPDFYASLMSYARELDVTNNFRVLGLIPFTDLAVLMQHALAILNPSLFEGWSTTVEEAKSLGKFIILSDIPVHHEQAPEGGVFFDPHDAMSLARTLKQFQAQYRTETASRLSERARSTYLTRRNAFARRYQDIVLEML